MFGTGDGEKWKNEQLKKHYFFKTKDGFLMAIENEKYKSISSDLWFDDEQEIPEKTKALFINYNIKLHCNDYNEQNYYYFMQNYFEKFPYIVNVRNTRSFVDYETEQQQKYYKRDLTDAEKKDFLNIKKLIHTKYVERLEKYFNRYSQYIHCRGYWVNR